MSARMVAPIAPGVSVLPDNTHAVIFLDVDGVLNSHAFLLERRPYDATGPDALDPTLVVRLNPLVRPGVAWILSSSWRYCVEIERMTEMLRGHGWTGTIAGATPMWVGDHRGETIAAWCREHGWDGPLVVIDDDPDVEPYKVQSVHVDPSVGLTEADVTRAVAMLDEGST